jgi:hypothetical protein
LIIVGKLVFDLLFNRLSRYLQTIAEGATNLTGMTTNPPFFAKNKPFKKNSAIPVSLTYGHSVSDNDLQAAVKRTLVPEN